MTLTILLYTGVIGELGGLQEEYVLVPAYNDCGNIVFVGIVVAAVFWASLALVPHLVVMLVLRLPFWGWGSSELCFGLWHIWMSVDCCACTEFLGYTGALKTKMHCWSQWMFCRVPVFSPHRNSDSCGEGLWAMPQHIPEAWNVDSEKTQGTFSKLEMAKLFLKSTTSGCLFSTLHDHFSRWIKD